MRKIADKLGLVNAEKKDSTGICFIGERNFRSFLQNYLPNQRGEIVDVNGKSVGEHIGLMYYTLGQRRGWGLGGTAEGQGRWFVVEKRFGKQQTDSFSRRRERAAVEFFVGKQYELDSRLSVREFYLYR